MTNEEKLAELSADIEHMRVWLRLCNGPGYGALERALARLESDLARLTAPRGKTQRIRFDCYVRDRGMDGVIAVRAALDSPIPGEADAVGFIDVPLREVPVVEGEVL